MVLLMVDIVYSMFFREVVTDLLYGRRILPLMHPRPAPGGGRLVAKIPADSSHHKSAQILRCRNGEGGQVFLGLQFS